ncbi:protein BCP1 [Sarotherodon galilaeus]
MGLWSCGICVVLFLCDVAYTATISDAVRQKGTQRHLLMEVNNNTNSTSPTKTASPNDSSKVELSYLAIALGTVITLSLFIVLVVKFRVLHRFLASYRHSLLQESDGASQYGQEDMSFPNNVSGRMGVVRGTQTGLDDDDDGFIEDNYIQPSEKHMPEGQREDEEIEGTDDSDDDLQFTIG